MKFEDFLITCNYVLLTILTLGAFPYFLSEPKNSEQSFREHSSISQNNPNKIKRMIQNGFDKYQRIVNHYSIRTVVNDNLTIRCFNFLIKFTTIALSFLTFGIFLVFCDPPIRVDSSKKQGKFIVLEGIDGSGKTTQVINVVKTLFDLNKNNQVLLTREPTWRSKNIRQNLENGNTDPQWLTKAFIEDRKLHVENEISPSLDNNIHVVCDRYYLSTLAYQGAQGMDIKELMNLHKDWIIKPDLIILFDCPTDISSKRCQMSDQFDKNLEFQSILRKIYLDLASDSTLNENISIIDASEPLDVVKDKVSSLVIGLINGTNEHQRTPMNE